MSDEYKLKITRPGLDVKMLFIRVLNSKIVPLLEALVAPNDSVNKSNTLSLEKTARFLNIAA